MVMKHLIKWMALYFNIPLQLVLLNMGPKNTGAFLIQLVAYIILDMFLFLIIKMTNNR